MPSSDLERLMWAEACEMLDRAERLQRQFFRPRQGPRVGVWEPPVDIYETADGFWLVAAMPGAHAESIEVGVQGAELVIRGERRLPPAAHTGTVQRLEIPHGRFERRLPLPPGSYTEEERNWRDGCFYLRLRYVGQGMKT